MGEVVTSAAVEVVDYLCDSCKVGYYRPTGSMLCSNPPQYPHICNNLRCKASRNLRDEYPTTRVRP